MAEWAALTSITLSPPSILLDSERGPCAPLSCQRWRSLLSLVGGIGRAPRSGIQRGLGTTEAFGRLALLQPDPLGDVELHSAAECFIAQMRICDLRVRIVRDGHEPNEAEEQRPCCVPIEPVHVISWPKDRREQEDYQNSGSFGENGWGDFAGVTTIFRAGVHAATLSTKVRRGFCSGNAYAKTQTNGGSTYGADQGTRGAARAVAGENDHAALSNERYMGGHC